MQNRRLLLACGTIMSVLVAGQALAQNEQPRPATPDRPATTPAPVDRPAIQPTPAPRTTRMDAPSVLRDLEGVWRVEIQCHGDHWAHMQKDMMNTPDRTSQPNPRPVDPSRPNDPAKPVDPNKSPTDPNKPANPTDPKYPTDTQPANPSNPSNPSNPNRPANPSEPNNPDRVQDPFKRDQPGTTPGAPGTGQMKQFVGYSETRLVLSNTLLEKIIVPDMLLSGTGKTPGRIDSAPTTVPSAPNDEMFRGLGIISFDPSSQQYSCAFVDSRTGRIHHDVGTFNESEKRLVFNGSGRSNDPNMRMNDVRVVVDLISPTQHRVSMYARDVGTAPNRPDVKSPTIPPTPNTPAPENTRPTTTPPTTPSADGTLIYQATYTRASSEDAPKFRRLLQEPGSTTIPGLDRDRDNR